jgi:hypothetical protein
MHIIYHCVGGTHSSAVASAIHLKMLPRDRVATADELLSVPYFDTLTKKEYGRILRRGIDEYGNHIYTLSRQFSAGIVIPALIDLSVILTGNDNEVIFIDASPAVNTVMKIGGFLSRRAGLVAIGRPIVIWGTKKAYMDIAGIVNNAIAYINSR